MQPSASTSAPDGPDGEPLISWKDDPKVRYMEETDRYVYTGDDSVAYEWDEGKKAWFPMWNESLIESQQAAYGPTVVEEPKAAGDKKGKRKQHVYTSDEPAGKKAKGEPKKRANTSVYVTGLPTDATEEEMKEVFEKFGILMEDLTTGKPKIKMYKDAAGVPKGDALVSYFKEESVELACNLLDDSDFRAGSLSKIRVQAAVFQEKEKPAVIPGEASQTAAKAVANKKGAPKKVNKLGKRLEWFEDEPGKKDKSLKLVVLKHMFTLKELEEDPTLLLDLKQDVRDECEKLGEITNIVLYDLEENGVMTIKFKEPEAAELCIRKMNGRFFAGRRIDASLSDGKAKYRQSSSGPTNEAAEQERLAAYQEWLEAQH
ncbi:hypothetical protein HKX48_004707 [Thoreauomyces humboldtii]|nr:hypothetical protein HKX48_004707 [Thoreauomyces humboldtii]